jgi:hypothetical protein
MAKEKKTAKELAVMIAEQLGVPPVRVTVFKDPQRGWYAAVATGYADMSAGATAIDEVSREMRTRYALKD